ncbi:MAG: TetR/AcrR family transcriptional regulator [Tunicatimonas sp.]|uniref:TetR/AcrR family transcriptional regulator n=1 Tax=Tunicatimonas sp. TaxID=1940096 RepID=UPI003C7766F1
MVDTKQKITQAATELYNTYGIASVRLQQIADLAGLSIGNLAYHFKNKEAITLAVVQDLTGEVKDILKMFRQTSDFLDFDRQLSEWFSFHQRYAFYFSDHTPWLNEELQQRRVQSSSRLICQIQKRFDFHRKRGSVKSDMTAPDDRAVAETIGMVITLWPSHRRLQGQSAGNEKEYKKAVWSQMLPYFTTRGLAEYTQLIQPLLSSTK